MGTNTDFKHLSSKPSRYLLTGLKKKRGREGLNEAPTMGTHEPPFGVWPGQVPKGPAQSEMGDGERLL